MICGVAVAVDFLQSLDTDVGVDSSGVDPSVT